MSQRAVAIWTVIITSVAVFMVSLDNLVVTTALPVIKADLGASLAGLEWTVNAYTLTFAVFLLTGAALGDRFGRKRLFVVGLALFTVSSAAAALAPGIGWLIAARALQGMGGAIVTPLTLTILSAAVPPARRGMALGIWGGVSGLAVAIGPVVGGAVVEGISWQWIFWLNVPIGLALMPVALLRIGESRGQNRSLDLPALGLASAGLFGLVWGLVRGNEHGWTSLGVAGSLAAGVVLLVALVLWELRTRTPMVPMRFFRRRAFTAANLTSLLMSFGMFGAIFLLAQFFQIVQGYSPLEAGLLTLPWTAMPIFVAPIAGFLTDRIGSRPLVVTGMFMMAAGLAWIALITSPTVPYLDLVPAFVLAGSGMSLYFAPVANLVLGSVRRQEEGQASGVNNTIREVGGVFGIAVLASVFSSAGGYASAQAFVDGLGAAAWIGAAAVALAGVSAVLIPSRKHLLALAEARDGRDATAVETAGRRAGNDARPHASGTAATGLAEGGGAIGGTAARPATAGVSCTPDAGL